jgi:hypothetical protein
MPAQHPHAGHCGAHAAPLATETVEFVATASHPHGGFRAQESWLMTICFVIRCHALPYVVMLIERPISFADNKWFCCNHIILKVYFKKVL